jgi:hypothetical protein
MKRALLLTLAAACCAAVPATATAANRTPANCVPKKSKTLAASAEARVYSIGTTAYACRFGARTSFLLGDTKECQNQTEVGDFRLGKGVLGYETSSCGLVSGQGEILVLDLRTGRTKWSGSPVDQTWSGGESSTSIEAWEMKRNGSIAWIGRNSGFVTTPGGGPAPANDLIQVWKNERGKVTKLDEGPDIATGSLALGSLSNRSTGAAPIYWRNGATAMSATLR